MYPSIEHKIDLWEIFLVFPEMNANALANDFTGPSSEIISAAISLKYGRTYSFTYFKLITMSLALDFTMSAGWGGPIFLNLILASLYILSRRGCCCLV